MITACSEEGDQRVDVLACYERWTLPTIGTAETSAARPQQGPGGMGAPCGQVFGWPRKVQILSVASGDRMCSNLQACCSISVSLSMARLSVNSRSARRWRRIISAGALASSRSKFNDHGPVSN